MKISELLELVHNEYINFNFKHHLNMYVSSKNYQPYNDNLPKLRKNLDNFLEKKNYKKLIETCYNIFIINPFDIESHIIASKSAKLLEKNELSKLHNFIASSLLDLIITSKKGKNYKDAFIINFPEDEIAIFTFFKNYPRQRVNQEKNDRIYDIYSMEKGGELFFDVTTPFMTISGEK